MDLDESKERIVRGLLGDAFFAFIRFPRQLAASSECSRVLQGCADQDRHAYRSRIRKRIKGV